MSRGAMADGAAALILTIENETSLPDGGPLQLRVSGRRGIDIGRDTHLDWTLPDPTRFISGKHCEVRYQDGGYWLYDVSTNGTFVNGSGRRVQAPHRLRDGDRLEIGHYIIAVAVEGEARPQTAPEPERRSPNSQEFWSGAGEVAPPISPRDLQAPKPVAPGRPDFLDWAVEAPAPTGDFGRQRSFAPDPPVPPPPAPGSLPSPADDWSRGAPPPPPVPEAYVPVPSPRRPGADSRAENPWAASAFGGEAPAPVTPAAVAAGWDDVPPIGAPPAEVEARAAPAPTAPPPAAEPRAPAFAPPPQDAPTPPSAVPAGGLNLAREMAAGAGVPEDVFAKMDQAELARLAGSLIRLAAEDLKQLLNARAEAKRFARSTSQTMVQAVDNNPLKFAPTAEDALRIMFAPRTRGYLDARRAFEQGFRDLKTHQVKTFSAMQAALRLLVEDLDPAAIEEATEPDKGLSAMLGSRKAKLWDIYQARWAAKTDPHDDGLVDAFMLYFSECYDRGGSS